MKERPILFSAPMVQAILDGRKTQTRQTRGLEKINYDPDAWELLSFEPSIGCLATFRHTGHGRVLKMRCPFGVQGDRLWCQEPWAQRGHWVYPHNADDHEHAKWDGWTPENTGKPVSECVTFDVMFDGSRFRKRSPVHMPRWASRIYLLVKDVRIKRLHDITELGAEAEGVLPTENNGTATADALMEIFGLHRLPYTSAFATLWESINGRGSWAENPWVWVVEFERIKP